MACPFFLPRARFNDPSWAIPPRLPLGDPFSGECHATASSYTPDVTTLRECCNLGYGRGHCPRFPEGSEADAVRFHVTLHDGAALHVQYVLEKDCWPVRHGSMEYDGGLRGSTNEILDRQVTVFAESYLRRASRRT